MAFPALPTYVDLAISRYCSELLYDASTGDGAINASLDNTALCNTEGKFNIEISMLQRAQVETMVQHTWRQWPKYFLDNHEYVASLSTTSTPTCAAHTEANLRTWRSTCAQADI